MSSTYKPTPTQLGYMLDEAYVRVLAGPVGGGKSVTCVHELVRLACGQAPNAKGVRKTRAIIVRNTADQLALTTRKTVFDWLPPGEAGIWKAVEKTFILMANLPDGTKVESEWIFIPLDTPDDVRKALSLETTFLWGNESRELNSEVVDGLLSRLNRYPSAKDGGPTRSCALFDTNMPDEDTWWHDKMENPPSNWTIHVQPAAIIKPAQYLEKYGEEPEEALLDKDGNEWAVNPGCDNYDHLPKQYYPNIIPGKTEDWLRVYLRSEYGRSLSGTPVYEKTFTYEFHVAKDPIKPIRNVDYPVIIGLDFGRTPAAVFKQRDPRGRVVTLAELTSENMGIETFLRTKLNPFIANKLQGCSFIVAPDPAGYAKQQQGEMSLVDVVRAAGFKCQRPPTNDPEKRIQGVERLLVQQLEGKALYLIDPSCTMLIKGFRYGYRYKIRKSGEMEDKPDKNQFSHCFVGETPVLTPSGYKPIASLKVGDSVTTRNGVRRVTATMNQQVTDLVEVSSPAGSVVCTPNHPFLVDGVRVRADALQYATILESTTGENPCAPPNTPSQSSTGFATTESRAATLKRSIQTAARTFTALFGRTTMGLSPTGITSTTRTMTAVTTHLKTLNFFALQTMRRCTGSTEQSTVANSLLTTCGPLCSPQPHSGMDQRQDWRGTESTEKKPGLVGSPWSLFVPTVRSSTTGLPKCLRGGFAPPSAKARLAAPAELTMNLAHVKTAGLRSPPTSTPRQSTVVPVAVRRIAEKTPVRVYDLTVEVDHEFVANGFVVGNCHDANQYADAIMDMNIRGATANTGRREIKPTKYVYT